MPGTTPIEAGTELDYLLRCVADGLGRLATNGYAAGQRDRQGRAARTIECEPFNGEFTTDELKKVAARSPGMRASLVGISDVTHVGDGQIDLDCQFAAAIVTQAKSNDWDGLAVRTMQAVVAGMHWQNWGTHQGRTPFLFPRIGGARAENLYGKTTREAGVTFWAITWHQRARVPATTLPLIDGPAELHVKDCPPYGIPPLRTPADRFAAADRAAAEAVRDMTLTDTADFDADPNLGIVLSWPNGDHTCVIYQVRRGGAWHDWYTHVETLSDWPAP